MTRLWISSLVCVSGLMFAADADQAYDEGMRFARAGQWTEAREAFLRGRALAPQQKRFALELAGVAFRTGDRARAIGELRRALALDPQDAYANEALGSLYLLDGRLDAALVYWNRIDKPRIHAIVARDELRRAVEISPGEVLTEEAMLETTANLDRLGFPATRMELVPRGSDSFDFVVQAADPAVAGSSVPGWALQAAAGLPYETLSLSFRPGRQWFQTIEPTIRWDPNKRLADLRVSGLVAGNPRLRYVLDANARDENWDIRASSAAPFTFTSATAGAEIEAGITSRLRWTNGFIVTNVHYADAPAGSVFANGIEGKAISRVSYQALRLSSKRLFVTLEGEAQAGGLDGVFEKFRAGAQAHWTHGETHAIDVHGAFSVGTSWGHVPFNELYALGMSRDNDLWIRGHTAEYDGRKGNAPMGGRYVLTQSDALKGLYENGFVRWELGPFVDSGKISGTWGSQGWLLDAGVESRLRLLRSLTLVGIYGRDTIHGGGVIFTAIRTGGY